MRTLPAALLALLVSACATQPASVKDEISTATAAWAEAFNDKDPSRVAIVDHRSSRVP